MQDLIDTLRQHKYTPVVVSSDKADFKNCLNLSGKLSIREFFSVVKACDYVLTVDTGTLHIAGAFEKKTLALFGPIAGDWRCSTYRNCIFIQAECKCSPCADTQWVRKQDMYCNVNKHGCLDTIGIDLILQELKHLQRRK
jgi:ADP-heptose:LPS heptosyltransferase